MSRLTNRLERFGDHFEDMSPAILVAVVLLVICPLIMPGIVFAGTDTYPQVWKTAQQGSVLDDWGEYNRECTSYVAWMLHSVNGFEMPFSDDAFNWGARAKSLGYIVDSRPALGSVYWTYNPGHVAWVESISSDATAVTIEEYNYAGTGEWNGAYREYGLSLRVYPF